MDENIKVEDISKESSLILKNIKEKIKPSLSYIEKNSNKLFIILSFSLLIILILGLIFSFSANSTLKNKIAEINELNKPIKIQLSIIGCNGCSEVDLIVDSIKKKNVDITKEETLDVYSEKGKELIQTYNIEKLPSILIFGEIDNEKVNFNDFKKVNDGLILDKLEPPYLDLVTNEIKGKVNIIEIIDSSCENCVSLESIPLGLSQAGVFIDNWEKKEYNSIEGKQIINKYGVKQVPAVLISTDIDYYEAIKQGLAQLDLDEKQGYYVLHSTVPPYRDLATNNINGLVDFIMLKDDSCSECYDVSVNKQVLERFGVVINTENTYDISSSNGKQLISKYNIQKVPIIIMSPEAKVYGSFVNAWQQIGSEENDGWFIMRKPEIMGTSKNLITGQLINTQ